MNKPWPLLLKMIFLFLFSYFVLYTNSCQFILSSVIEPIWKFVTPKFAGVLGHMETLSMNPSGSGDTTYDYYKILLFGVLAFVAMIMVSAFDFRRSQYATLLRWLVVLVRYYLAMQMISYGLAKLFYMQFSFPTAMRLDQPLGEFSPMGLLWTFMGYSKTYTVFTGIMEFVGGLFLLSRYTSTLGALITFGVMANVMMMNYCYDVPVKLLSTHMVLMAIGLILLDGKRLLNFFILQKSADSNIPEGIIPLRFQKAKNIIKWLVIIGYLGISIFQMYKYSVQYVDDKASYFDGKHDVVDYKHLSDSTEHIPLPDSIQWKEFYQSWKGYAMVKTKSDDKLYFNFEPDEEKELFRIKVRADNEFYELPYVRRDSITIDVKGYYFRDSISFSLVKKDVKEHRLVRRGFRWINERPYNR